MRRLTLFAATHRARDRGLRRQSDSEKSASDGGDRRDAEQLELRRRRRDLKLAADKSALKFDKSSLTAKAGKVTLVMANPSGIPHAVAVEGNGVDTKGSRRQGGTRRSARPQARQVRVLLPGRRPQGAGMEGTLTVK